MSIGTSRIDNDGETPAWPCWLPHRQEVAMPRSKGRTGRRWRRARTQVLTASTICHLCGHDGAGDVDHDPPLATLTALGLDPCDLTHLRPAHGALSRCPTCQRCCNQIKGNRIDYQPAPPASRDW